MIRIRRSKMISKIKQMLRSKTKTKTSRIQKTRMMLRWMMDKLS